MLTIGLTECKSTSRSYYRSYGSPCCVLTRSGDAAFPPDHQLHHDKLVPSSRYSMLFDWRVRQRVHRAVSTYYDTSFHDKVSFMISHIIRTKLWDLPKERDKKFWVRDLVAYLCIPIILELWLYLQSYFLATRLWLLEYGVSSLFTSQNEE